MLPRHRRPGSTAALRIGNERAILRELLQRGPATQSELARRTRLSPGTVSSIVNALRQRQLVTTSATVSSGRKATLVTPAVGEKPIAVGIDLGRAHVGLALVRPGREVVAERQRQLPPGLSAEDAVAQARDLLLATLEEVGKRADDVVAVGFGVPGPIDAVTQSVVDGTILPEWVGRSAADVERVLGMPVVLGNDADLAAIAEHAWGDAADVDNLMFVKVGTGIGSGLLLGGSLYTGAFGIAGEIGHTTVNPAGSHCRCGNRGCLETVAGTKVIAGYVSDATGREISTAELVELARRGHRATELVLADAGAALGQAIAVASNILGPQQIVVGGPLLPVGNALIEPIRESFARFAIPAVAEQTSIVWSSLQERGGALGAATLALAETDAVTYLVDDTATKLRSDVDGITQQS